MDWQLPSKATELLWTLVKLPLRSYRLSPSARRAPAVKYDHTASSGVLWPLSCQRSCQQFGTNEEMHILDNSQTLNPFVKTLRNYVQIIAYPGERDLTNIFRPDTETTDFSLWLHWWNLPILTKWNLQILTVSALRKLGKNIIHYRFTNIGGVANPWFIGPWCYSIS